jgi:hypothetical protein
VHLVHNHTTTQQSRPIISHNESIRLIVKWLFVLPVLWMHMTAIKWLFVLPVLWTHTTANHRHGIRITNPKRKEGPVIQPISIIPTQLLPAPLPLPAVVYDATMPNLIGDEEDDESIANVFCFGAFADKHCGVVYNDCTGSFLFMLLDGCVCFLSYIITNPTQSWPPQFQAWTI